METLNELDYKSLATVGMLSLASLLPTSAAVTKPVSIKAATTQPYTVADVIAATLVDEAGGEKDCRRGMHAVLNVIEHRGKDLSGMAKKCLEPKQFAGWNTVNKSDIKSVVAYIDEKKQHSAYKIALELVTLAKAKKLEDITKGATHFINVRAAKNDRKDGKLPKWYDKKKVTVTIGHHEFLKL